MVQFKAGEANSVHETVLDHLEIYKRDIVDLGKHMI